MSGRKVGRESLAVNIGRHSHSQREILSPVFIPEKLTFSHCLRTRNAAKKLLIHIEGSFDPRLLHHTFLL